MLLKSLGFGLIYLNSISACFAQADSITNERIPIKAKQLEAHWQVNCDQTLVNAEHLLIAGNRRNGAITTIQKDLEKCTHIYNTPNTIHFKPKPDYRLIHKKLNDIVD